MEGLVSQKVMSMEMDRKRSIVKTLSWRVLATTDTFIIAYLVTYFILGEAEPGIAGTIAGVEVMTKLFLYYFHERGWAQITWGVRPSRTPEQKAADLHAEADTLMAVVEAQAETAEAVSVSGETDVAHDPSVVVNIGHMGDTHVSDSVVVGNEDKTA
jgi:uncharacterized membrane protein